MRSKDNPERMRLGEWRPNSAEDVTAELSGYGWGLPDRRGRDVAGDPRMLDKYRTMSARKLHRKRFGTCWDHVAAQRALYKALNIPHDVYYIELNNPEKASHTVVVRDVDGKPVWDESAWKDRTGHHEGNDINGLLSDIAHQMNDLDVDADEAVVYRIPTMPSGLSIEQYKAKVRELGEKVADIELKAKGKETLRKTAESKVARALPSLKHMLAPDQRMKFSPGRLPLKVTFSQKLFPYIRSVISAAMGDSTAADALERKNWTMDTTGHPIFKEQLLEARKRVSKKSAADTHGEGGDGWIGVDLDATLAEYTEWKGPSHVGAPIEKMVDRVKKWLEEGKDVRILTARVSPGDAEEVKKARTAIKAFCKEQFGKELHITDRKDKSMIELWDDRVVQVKPNTGERVDRKACGEFALKEYRRLLKIEP